MEYQCPAELSHCVCMCARVHVCVCPAAIRWHLTCSHVWSGYLCVAVCACLFHWSAEKSWLYLLVSALLCLFCSVPSLAACQRSCWLRWLPRRAAALSVFLPCRLKRLCSAFCSCSALTLCGVNGKSQKAALLNRIAVRGRRVGTTAHLPPFNLLLYCYWESVSHVLHHYFGILSLPAHALVFLVWLKYMREASCFTQPACLNVQLCLSVLYGKVDGYDK